MLVGHGNDKFKYKTEIKSDFSSNIPNDINHKELYEFLKENLTSITDYPEPTAFSIKERLAHLLSLKEENLCITNGATESIYLIAQHFHGSHSCILSPTFSEYADACRIHKHTVSFVKDLGDIPQDAQIIWLCNPNNPTGALIGKKEISRLIRDNMDKIWVIDQSYEALAQEELLSAEEAAVFPNLLLIHSLTKEYAIPGLRIGYTTGHGDLIQKIEANQMPWSVNQVAILAACHLLDHPELYRRNVSAIFKERDHVIRALRSIPGLHVADSRTNFILVEMKERTAASLKDYLVNNHGILIRDCSNFEGLDEHYFRIAIQTPEENEKLINAVKSWITTE